ncbi:hypothetical protein K439DRAFT_607255 [Ramaria rubella]|nr:hypothetical protein K439DRAFT_607255 [Ramaria rubella]
MRGGKTDHEHVKSLTAILETKLDAYDKIFAKQSYLAGNEVTLADLFHLSYGTLLTKVRPIRACGSSTSCRPFSAETGPGPAHVDREAARCKRGLRWKGAHEATGLRRPAIQCNRLRAP